jgi:wyosine [tRNA(Phe)-imidazoG37] synthetase (radical SAM superfamily)
MKYVYGPVRSRRLGNSLGISTVPYKVCSFDCVYCQLKETTEKTLVRKNYIAPSQILKEVSDFFKNKPADLKIDHVTFSGSGEPTLHRSIGALIRAVKALVGIPVVLITNSSTLVDPKVRRDISSADLIIPSLDAVTQDVFEKIDQPAPAIRIDDIIDALIKLRKTFRGLIWLEIMLVRGLNDSPQYLARMKKVTDLIMPDRIQINSPVRLPAQRWVRPATAASLKKAKEIFGEHCDIIA